MKHQLALLREPLPVMLDPVLRLGRGGALVDGASHLPMHPQSRTLLTFSGTAAVYQAAVALGLRAGDRVLMPAYCCGHEVEPFLRAGANVAFYRIDRRLAIDIEHLAASIDSATRAVLVTHYFGFPQPLDAIRALCERHGIALIEDCAHALCSRDGETPLGLAGHLAVYSLRKTLPLPHGGALVCHDPRWPIPAHLPRPPVLSTLPKRLERYQKGWLLPARGGPGIPGRAAFIATRLLVDATRGVRRAAHTLGAIQFDPDDESFGFPAAALGWGIAESVEQTLRAFDAAGIAAARRRNYGQLLEAADGFTTCRALLPALPAGVAPLYFPVLADDPEQLVARLRSRAIGAIEWWGTPHAAVPWAPFPDAQYLKEHIVALPVHQDLRREHIERIVAGLGGRYWD